MSTCLRIKVELASPEISPKVKIHLYQIDDKISVKTSKIDGMNVCASLQGQLITPSVANVTSRMNISCGIVCTVSNDPYLIISPSEVQWITDDIGVLFTVNSNTEWMVLADDIPPIE